MTSEKINHMPPLKMGKATCRWIRGALGHYNELVPKSLFLNPKKAELKHRVDSENFKEGGNNEAKRKAFGRNNERGY
jgi:hypothetical protein